MSNKFVVLTAPITIGGSLLAEDEIIELPEKSADALIAEDKAQEVEPDEGKAQEVEPDEGKAQEVEPDEETAKELDALQASEGQGSPEDENGSQVPQNDDKEGTENEGDQTSDEDRGKIVKALDAKYNRDPLADKAKEAGVEFAYDAKKGKIIDAVIKAGKADALLQQ